MKCAALQKWQLSMFLLTVWPQIILIIPVSKKHFCNFCVAKPTTGCHVEDHDITVIQLRKY